MDKKTENIITKRIIKALANELKNYGYIQTKEKWIIKINSYLVGFIHFHKFTHSPSFRIHTGIRILNDTFDAISLNGLHEENAGQFLDNEKEINKCIKKMKKYCTKKSLPWIEKYSSIETLLNDKNSPLDENEKISLSNHIKSKFKEDNVQRSNKLLGIKKSHIVQQPLPGSG